MSTRLKCVIVMGNPKYIKGNYLAKNYYDEIQVFLETMGVKVSRDPGLHYTCPPKADFYIGHSRGISRIICFEELKSPPPFLKFGGQGGINHPIDEASFKNYKEDGYIPVKEHYYFTESQREAIRITVKKLSLD